MPLFQPFNKASHLFKVNCLIYASLCLPIFLSRFDFILRLCEPLHGVINYSLLCVPWQLKHPFQEVAVQKDKSIFFILKNLKKRVKKYIWLPSDV
jgi:hypothetical protein